MAIIGILSAISFPKFYHVIRDRKVNRNAMEIMNFYRLAKTRALGRGSAVMVRFTKTGPNSSIGYLEMREAVMNSTPSGLTLTNALPTSSCTATTWENNYQGANGGRPVTFRDMGPASNNLGTYEFMGPGALAAQTGTLSPQPQAELCFTPRGRTFIRYVPATTWFPLSSVPRIDVFNARLAAAGAGVVRSVFVPPSGTPRMGL